MVESSLQIKAAERTPRIKVRAGFLFSCNLKKIEKAKEKHNLCRLTDIEYWYRHFFTVQELGKFDISPLVGVASPTPEVLLVQPTVTPTPVTPVVQPPPEKKQRVRFR